MTIETSPAKTIHPSKQRGSRFWISLFALLLGLLLPYYAYCWGWWGRDSLLLQYIFQCGCPVSSDEMRYPERVDVVVPACRHNAVRLSPSGRILYVDRRALWNDISYLLDLQTDEKIPFTLPGGLNYFLTDEIMFHSFYGDDEYIWDRITGKQYPIQKFGNSWRPDAYINGEVNFKVLAESLRGSKYVFLIDDDFLVALAPDFQANPEHNFHVRRSVFPGYGANQIEQFLQENGIVYDHVDPDYYNRGALSPDGDFIARNDGIYLAATDQKIVNGYPGIEPFDPSRGKYFALRGWVYDSTGALYSSSSGLCLMQIFLMNETECIIKVPQPVLKLKVPQEYLPSSSAYPNPNKSE